MSYRYTIGKKKVSENGLCHVASFLEASSEERNGTPGSIVTKSKVTVT